MPTTEADLLTASYDYALPEAQIAQTPAHPRDHSRLLVVTPSGHHHQHFYDLPQWLQPGDLLVLNNTRVIPARLYGHKKTGSRIEILLLEPQREARWLALVKPGKRIRIGDQLLFEQGLRAEVLEMDPDTGGRILEFHWPQSCGFADLLEQVGELPLPPYITSRASQPSDYQTIWAQTPGSVAAPTAGLHFTPALLAQLEQQGIHTCFVTLNVGLGTFRPVEAETITDHHLHREWLQVPPETIAAIVATHQRGGRILGVGTTVARALETASQGSQHDLQPWQGHSQLFIYPGYQWQVIEGLVTNFHLPRSSLLMMISALIGRERLLDLYNEAIQTGYRFYSFGDAMLLLP